MQMVWTSKSKSQADWWPKNMKREAQTGETALNAAAEGCTSKPHHWFLMSADIKEDWYSKSHSWGKTQLGTEARSLSNAFSMLPTRHTPAKCLLLSALTGPVYALGLREQHINNVRKKHHVSASHKEKSWEILSIFNLHYIQPDPWKFSIFL